MRRGVEIDDYVVTVGTVVLFNRKLYDDRLIVRLVKLDLYDRGDEPGCGQLYPVRVTTTYISVYL